MSSTSDATIIHTDGGCLGNPGVGGWAFSLRPLDGQRREGWGGEQRTTNNRMELTAVIRALAHLADDPHLRSVPAELYTDSRYVEQGLNSWLQRWVLNGWQTAGKQPVKNADLWRLLVDLPQQVQVSFHWVRGHAGDEDNERCHELVQAAIAEVGP